MRKIKVGAVIYAPRVTVIWKIISDFFKEEGVDMEPVFFKDYKSQVDALENHEIDIAWNSPLAWLDAHLRFNGAEKISMMRDTDRDRSTFLVVKNMGNIETVEDLRGKKIAFGATDSPQARLIPIFFLKNSGLEYKKDYEEVVFDVGVGLHGDHVGGEKDALEALKEGKVDAAFMLDLNYNAWRMDGTIDESDLQVLTQTPPFDHCIFTAAPDLSDEVLNKFTETLSHMDYNNENHKEMMDMEGLKEWVEGRLSGFEQIKGANEYLGFFKNA